MNVFRQKFDHVVFQKLCMTESLQQKKLFVWLDFKNVWQEIITCDNNLNEWRHILKTVSILK